MCKVIEISGKSLRARCLTVVCPLQLFFTVMIALYVVLLCRF